MKRFKRPTQAAPKGFASLAEEVGQLKEEEEDDESDEDAEYVNEEQCNKETSSSKVEPFTINLDSDVDSNKDDSIMEGWESPRTPFQAEGIIFTLQL